MNHCALSVVIPAHNEAERIESSLEHIVRYLSRRSLSFEILVIDDGSQDRTFQIAQAFSPGRHSTGTIRLFRNERRRGKGYSVRKGMLEARGECALLTDADLSAPIEEIQRLEREMMDESCHIAFGSRAAEGARIEVHQSWFRENSGKLFNRFVRLFLGLPYWDTQCGFKLFKMSLCRALFQKQTIEGFGFDVELLYIARKWGLVAREIPIVWRHASGSKVRFIRDAGAMLMDSFRIRWNDWQGQYDR